MAASVTAGGLQLNQLNIKAPRNGYVYVSNRSDQNVYFDNFKVTIQTGNIIEENHYYSYGLRIAAISSRKLPDANEGNIKNNNLYNDKELWDDGDINWYDYGFRNYDPQIGRFIQLDPLTDDYPVLTPYQYASGDPITNIDVDGLEGIGAVGGVARDFSYGANLASDMTSYIFPITHAVTAATSTVSKGFSAFSVIASVTSIVIHTSELASNVINSKFDTKQSGGFPISISPATPATGNPLTSQEEKQVKNALEFAQGLLEATRRRLNRWNTNDKTEFKNHFGLNDNASRDIIKNRINKEIGLVKFYLRNNNYKSHFRVTNQSGNWAHVIRGDSQHNIYLDALFSPLPC